MQNLPNWAKQLLIALAISLISFLTGLQVEDIWSGSIQEDLAKAEIKIKDLENTISNDENCLVKDDEFQGSETQVANLKEFKIPQARLQGKLEEFPYGWSRALPYQIIIDLQNEERIIQKLIRGVTLEEEPEGLTIEVLTQKNNSPRSLIEYDFLCTAPSNIKKVGEENKCAEWTKNERETPLKLSDLPNKVRLKLVKECKASWSIFEIEESYKYISNETDYESKCLVAGNGGLWDAYDLKIDSNGNVTSREAIDLIR